jgi:hypothetical protein
MAQYRIPAFQTAAISPDRRAVPIDTQGFLVPIDSAQEAWLILAGGVLAGASGPLSASQMAVTKSLCSAAGSVSVSRSAVASDNGATLGLPSGSTYTIADASLIAAGVILQGTSSGGGTIAVGGSVTINGGTASISLAARQVAVLLPTPGSSVDLTVKVAY